MTRPTHTAAHPHRPSPARRALSRIAVGVAIGLAVVVAGAGAASAHVRVDSPGATQGGYGVLTFRVPTESTTASTTALTIAFPSDTPFAFVATQPKPGWTATTTTEDLPAPITTDDGVVTTYVASVTWTADSADGGIAPGEFDTFAVLAGPLPDADSVSFPATQRYSDGTSVEWNEASTDGTEPEHPAPVLALAAASAGGGHDHGAATPSVTAQEMEMGSPGADTSWTGILGLVAGVLGLIAGGVALARTGRKAPSDS